MVTSQMDTVIRHLRRAVSRHDGAERTDGELLGSFINKKDEAAFAALIDRHGPMVFGVCRRVVGNHHDAEDAFQATFLVLARKASSVRPRKQVGNWLHGVALRTAMKARATTAKRRRREKQLTAMPESAAAPHGDWCDLESLLDQELNGLPERYRLPILLCDLEAKTIKEATQQLGWPQGTLAGRLARGRKLLAKRLANRGVVLSAGSLAAVVSLNVSSAGVPDSLKDLTLEAAPMFAPGQAAPAGLISAKVAILTEGVLKAMLLSKLKTAMAGLLLVALLCCAAGTIYETHAADQPNKHRRADTVSAVEKPQVSLSAKAAPQRQYVIVSRLLEAGVDRPKEVLVPRATIVDGQSVHLDISYAPQDLLAKVVAEEEIKIGILLDVRVTHLALGNKVRLMCSFQKNELETSSVSEVRVRGHSVQAIQVIELHKPVKILLAKEAGGRPQRWLEITVDCITPDKPVPTAFTGP